jgi:hypothetical protein
VDAPLLQYMLRVLQDDTDAAEQPEAPAHQDAATTRMISASPATHSEHSNVSRKIDEQGSMTTKCAAPPQLSTCGMSANCTSFGVSVANTTTASPSVSAVRSLALTCKCINLHK